MTKYESINSWSKTGNAKRETGGNYQISKAVYMLGIVEKWKINTGDGKKVRKTNNDNFKEFKTFLRAQKLKETTNWTDWRNWKGTFPKVPTTNIYYLLKKVLTKFKHRFKVF